MRIDYGEFPSTHFMATMRVIDEATAEASRAECRRLVAGAAYPEDPKLRRHLYGYILPGLAIYRVLRSGGLSQADALERVDRVMDIVTGPWARWLRRLGKLPCFYGLLRRFMKPFLGAYPASGWDTVWLELGRDRLRFDMRRCYYHDTLKAQGSPELTASFCRIDDLVYGGASPYYEWRRSKTIGRGDELCDFCFERRRPATAGARAGR